MKVLAKCWLSRKNYFGWQKAGGQNSPGAKGRGEKGRGQKA